MRHIFFNFNILQMNTSEYHHVMKLPEVVLSKKSITIK